MTKRLPILRRDRGTISKLADELGLTRPAVSRWEQVPASRVVAVSKITGISRHQLRPDIYPEPDNTPPALDAA